MISVSSKRLNKGLTCWVELILGSQPASDTNLSPSFPKTLKCLFKELLPIFNSSVSVQPISLPNASIHLSHNPPDQPTSWSLPNIQAPSDACCSARASSYSPNCSWLELHQLWRPRQILLINLSTPTFPGNPVKMRMRKSAYIWAIVFTARAVRPGYLSASVATQRRSDCVPGTTSALTGSKLPVTVCK